MEVTDKDFIEVNNAIGDLLGQKGILLGQSEFRDGSTLFFWQFGEEANDPLWQSHHNSLAAVLADVITYLVDPMKYFRVMQAEQILEAARRNGG
jgi:hypothetical protein